MLTTLAELCDQVKEPSLFCGEIDAQATGEIRQRLGLEVIIASPAASMRRAAYLAELGWERLARGDADNVSSAVTHLSTEPADQCLSDCPTLSNR